MSDTVTKSEEKTVEITDIFEGTNLGVAAPAIPSAAELKGKGWSQKEIDSAGKLGLLGEKTEVPAEPKTEAPLPEKVAEVKKVEPVKPKTGSLPDFTMSPEQEKVFFDTFGAGTAPRAMYFRMKNERQARQAAESKSKELEIRLQTLESVAKPPVEEGAFDPEDQPLTIKQLRELQRAEAEAIQKQAAENAVRSGTVVAAQNEQEEYARSLFADFDTTVGLAKEVMTNLDEHIPEKWKQTKIVKLVRDLQVAAAQADKFGLDEYHAAMIAYEIGQLHPQYGKAPAAKQGEEPGTRTEITPKGHGNLNAEQMKRVEKNTQLRSASAAVPAGSGKRTISVDDVDLKTLNAMSYVEMKNFRDKHPERYARLIRG